MSGVNLNDILTSFYLYFSSREVSDNNSKSVHLCVLTGSINIYRFHVLLFTFKRCDFYKIFYYFASLFVFLPISSVLFHFVYTATPFIEARVGFLCGY